MTEAETEESGTQYEQVVARRLSRADRARGRELGWSLTLIGIALWILIVEVAVMLVLMRRIIEWMSGNG